MNEPSTSAGKSDGVLQSSSTLENSIRLLNAQRIQQRKQQEYNYPKEKKIMRLASYSTCQACKCNSWKASTSKLTPQTASPSETCQNCEHTFTQHVAHLNDMSDSDLNKVLSMVVDCESIFISIHRDDDEELRRVYYYLYKLLRKSIAELKKTVVDTTLGPPPFEQPNINKAIMNFLLHKFSHLKEKEWQNICDVAKLFLNSLNQYNVEMPGKKQQNSPSEDMVLYKRNFSRWSILCQIPTFCDSFPRQDFSQIFGRTFLRSVFRSFKKQLLDKCYMDKDSVSIEKQPIMSAHMPRFLSLLEEELYSNSSPIWSVDFKQVFPIHLLPTIESSKVSRKVERDKLLNNPIDDSTSSVANKKSESEQSEIRKNDTKRRKIQHQVDDDDDDDDIPESTVQRILDEISNPAHISNELFKESTPFVELAKAAEEAGEIKVCFVSNSLEKAVDRNTMLLLIGLQGIFLHRLPKMPVEYISRFLYDPKHKTLALIKDGHPIGGICFRIFQSQGFSEIVFCAVKKSIQGKGYGSHLMNQLKDYHVRIGVLNFLTYADKRTSDYFKKQGFNEIIKLEPSVYQGFIKDYDGATLMHCELDRRIVYTELSSVLRKQKEILKKLMQEQKEKIGKVHPGLTCFKEGAKFIQIEEIPGLKETGWKPVIRTTRVSKITEEPIDPETLHKALNNVLKSIKSHDMAWPFQKPVDKMQVPDYYHCIKYPMDLRTVGERLKAGYYTSRRIFIADMQRIFNNCRTYNTPETEYFLCAKTLDRYFQAKMRELGLWDK